MCYNGAYANRSDEIKNIILSRQEIINRLEIHVDQFKDWLKKNYSQERIDEKLYDDAGYPNWVEVEETFEIAFKELKFEELNLYELEAIGFLIARQWNVGIIFPYFKEEISQVGMTEMQLLILSAHGINSKEWSLRQQCAASIWKAKNNRNEAIKIALQYYKDQDVDVRRHALNSLHKIKYNRIDELGISKM